MKDKKKRNIRSKSYILCAVLLLLLVVLAFILPETVLDLQDKKNMDDLHLAARTGLDYAAADMEYIADLGERLSAFAKGLSEGRQYFITSSEDTEMPDMEELFEGLMGQNLYWILLDNQISKIQLEDYKIGSYWDKIEILKKEYFVIYNDDASSGATFVCWYFQLRLEGEYDITLLIDAKDYTMYYIELFNANVTDLMSGWNRNSNYIINEFFLEMSYYYKTYGEYATTDSEYNSNSLGGLTIDGSVTNRYPLDYEEGSLMISVYLTDDKRQGYSGLCLGIQELIDLLPEDRKAVKFVATTEDGW